MFAHDHMLGTPSLPRLNYASVLEMNGSFDRKVANTAFVFISPEGQSQGQVDRFLFTFHPFQSLRTGCRPRQLATQAFQRRDEEPADGGALLPAGRE